MGGGDDDDRISKLPDDILVDVISRLSLKEAGRTSVLSPRWKNVWKHTPFLNFDADDVLQKIMEHHSSKDLIKIEAPKYVEWVNSVVRAHKSPTLKEFKIRFHLDNKYESSITQWLEFAFSKQVERLELNHENFVNLNEYYCLPDFSSFASCKSLKALSLVSVHVTDGAVEFFLRNCPLLEELVVCCSHKILDLEVCGPSLVLKHLDLQHSYDFRMLKICAPFLTSLKVQITKGLLIENVPMLVDLSLTSYSVKGLISAISCCFSQLEVLCFSLTSINKEVMSEHGNFPEMPKLKKLFIEYKTCGYESLVRLMASLIRKSPQLEEFALQYNYFPPKVRKDRQVEDAMWFPNNHVKVFKLSCDYSRVSDVMVYIVGGILGNCAGLEKIIVDTSDGYFPVNDRHKIARRNKAKQQLEPHVPRHIEFVVL
ncbi:hypothetical protein ABFX02_10G060900 [Erythranthe guttata]